MGFLRNRTAVTAETLANFIQRFEGHLLRKLLVSGFGTSYNHSVSGSWLDIEKVATAELSSEDPQHPFERALRTDTIDGWKASDPGRQSLRLRFDSPQTIKRVQLQFREEEITRSQEIALFATSKTSGRRELVRQQWVFSPQGATTELEDYFFDVKDVTTLELEIDPGRHDGQVFASLQSIQIG